MTIRELLVQIGFALNKSDVEKTEKKIEAVKAELNTAGKAGDKAGSEATKGINKIAPAANKAGTEIKEIAAVAAIAGAGVDRAMGKAAQEVKKVGAEADKMQEKLKKTHASDAPASSQKGGKASLSDVGDKLSEAGGKMVVGGRILAAPVIGATIAAMDFETAMADVRKVVDFDSPEEFKEMQNDILGLTKTLPLTAKDIAAIVAAGGQAGIAKKDLLSFAESAAKMGVAFDITADQAGDMMAKWRTAFKMGQPEVVELADKINYLSNKTATSAPIISDIVTRIGPLGDVGGVASDSIAALGATMASTGTPSEIAATGIKNLILGMVAGEGATKSQAAAFSTLGLDASGMAKRMQVDAKGAILDVLRAIRGLDKYQQASVLKDLFGSESISAIAPLLSNLDTLQQNLGFVADQSLYAGSMQSEFAARVDTANNGLQLLKNMIEIIATSAGTELLPMLKDLCKGFMEVAESVINWVKENPQLVKGILMGLLIFGALLGVMGAVIGIVGTIIGFILSMGAAWMIVEAAIAIIGAVCWPVVAVIAAIAAAIYVCIEHWDALSGMFEAGKQMFLEGLDLIAGAWYNIQPLIKALMPLLKTIATIIGVVIVGAVKFLWNLFTTAFTLIAAIINTVAYALGKVGDLISYLGGGLSGLIDKAAKFLGMQGEINDKAARSNVDFSKHAFSDNRNFNITVPDVNDIGSAMNQTGGFTFDSELIGRY